jgi:hypothetical protein
VKCINDWFVITEKFLTCSANRTSGSMVGTPASCLEVSRFSPRPRGQLYYLVLRFSLVTPGICTLYESTTISSHILIHIKVTPPVLMNFILIINLYSLNS